MIGHIVELSYADVLRVTSRNSLWTVKIRCTMTHKNFAAQVDLMLIFIGVRNQEDPHTNRRMHTKFPSESDSG